MLDALLVCWVNLSASWVCVWRREWVSYGVRERLVEFGDDLTVWTAMVENSKKAMVNIVIQVKGYYGFRRQLMDTYGTRILDNRNHQ